MHIFFGMLLGMLLTSMGYSFNTWQFWAITGLTMGIAVSINKRD